jgi:predicted lipoprotein with Yx(FWY)xxD motif
MRPSSKWLSAATLALAAFLVAACSSAAATPIASVLGATSAPTQAAGMSSGPAMGGSGAALVLQSSKTPAGTYLNGADGKTLYVFAKDAPDKSTCTGQCATTWPPLTVDSGQQVQGPPDATLQFGTITRDDGKMQVTYNHMPLYYFSGDVSAGGAMGQGLNGVWWVALVTGAFPSGGTGAGAAATPATTPAATPAASTAPLQTPASGYSY